MLADLEQDGTGFLGVDGGQIAYQSTGGQIAYQVSGLTTAAEEVVAAGPDWCGSWSQISPDFLFAVESDHDRELGEAMLECLGGERIAGGHEIFVRAKRLDQVTVQYRACRCKRPAGKMWRLAAVFHRPVIDLHVQCVSRVSKAASTAGSPGLAVGLAAPILGTLARYERNDTPLNQPSGDVPRVCQRAREGAVLA